MVKTVLMVRMEEEFLLLTKKLTSVLILFMKLNLQMILLPLNILFIMDKTVKKDLKEIKVLLVQLVLKVTKVIKAKKVKLSNMKILLLNN
jgi:hypothetical protein